MTDIDFNAFSNCENLTKAELPKSLTYLSYVAFEGCPKLKDIYYTGSKEEWEKIKTSKSYDYYLVNSDPDFEEDAKLSPSFENVEIHYNSSMK